MRGIAACLGLALLGSTHTDAGAQARYASPVERYGHFALGRPHEYAQIVVDDRTLTLPDDEVFEDLAPRRVQLIPGGPVEWLVIVSRRGSGARLALVGEVDGRLALTAQSAPIGTPNRWLNPVGAFDLDADGQAEIAAVITPHIGGTLKVFRRRDARLVDVAAMAGFSNHVYGSAELGLSTTMHVRGRPTLVVPDNLRTSLRLVRLDGDTLIDVGRCALPGPVAGALRAEPGGAVSFGTDAGGRRPGRVVVLPERCLD